MKRQFGGRGLEAVGSPNFFRARHAPLVGAVTVCTADALRNGCHISILWGTNSVRPPIVEEEALFV